MATDDSQEKLSRLQNVALRLTAELGGKNEKLKHVVKMLEENSTSLSRMTEKRDHLNRAYNAEKRKMKRTMDENGRLMREFEAQTKEIEKQAKEIEKRDAQLDFKSKELQGLRMLKNETHDSQKINTVQGKHGGVGNMSSRDKVQVQIDTNGLHNEVEVKDYELDSELSPKQTLVRKEHRSNHDLREAWKVSTEKVTKEDDEKPIEVIEEWGKGDIEGSGGVECNAFQDSFPPIPPSEYLVDPCNDMSNNSSDISTVLPGSNVTKEDDEELIKERGKGDIESSGGVECNAFQYMFPPIPPPESSVDPCNDMLDNSSYLSSALPVPDDEIAELEWLSTFVDDCLSAGGITVDIDYSNNNKKDDSATVRKNNSSCSGGKTMPPTPDTVAPTHVRSKRPRSAVLYEKPAPNLASHKSCLIDVEIQQMQYFAKSHPSCTPNFNGKEQKKKKKKKMKRLPPCMPSYSSDHRNSPQQQQQPGLAYQKCSHCEVTKTSIWREGPMGAGTLCNVCGMRYKAGQLFPEYRPKASPTFAASKRANSHRKKVLETRVKNIPARCIQLQNIY